MNEIVQKPNGWPLKSVKEGTGMATISGGKICVQGPIDYLGGQNLEDPAWETGYSHCFLRPFSSIVIGRKENRKKIVYLGNPGHIVYVLLGVANEIGKLEGLRCAGALTLSGDGEDLTLCFFPSLPKRRKMDYDLDHISAHIGVKDGKIIANEIHGKLRPSGGIYSIENVPLDLIQKGESNFAFEMEYSEAILMDPAGMVVGNMPPKINQKRLPKIIETVEHSVIKTIACSLPTPNGLVPYNSPLVVRVGVVLNSEIKKNGLASAVLEPLRHGTKPYGTRIHRYIDASKVIPSWPSDASVFVEVGIPPEPLPHDYSFFNFKSATINKYSGVTHNIPFQ